MFIAESLGISTFVRKSRDCANTRVDPFPHGLRDLLGSVLGPKKEASDLAHVDIFSLSQSSQCNSLSRY